MIDFSRPRKGTPIELPELSSARELPDPYFVVEDVFPGGMGVCLKLLHETSGESFALKVIKQDFIGRQTTWMRFVEELKWWLTLSACEGVAEAYCITRVNEIPCMCAAWLHHGNLRQFIGRAKPEFIFQTIVRIVRTLEWAYTKHGVIHRDLKPENVLLDQDWRAFVSDWGLAKVINSFFAESKQAGFDSLAPSPQLTQTGHMVGTMIYAAPEQILGIPSIDHRADIYSIGCMMFEWETGRPPFWGRSHLEIAQQQLHASPPKLGGLFRKTNLGLEEVIACCLEKEASKRFYDYDTLAKAILKTARRRGFQVEDVQLEERYFRAKPGSDALQTELAAKAEEHGGHAVIEMEEMVKHADQAMAEAALGNYDRAANILAPFHISEMCVELRDWTICHNVAVNYGYCLSQSQADQAKAVSVFESLLLAEPKSAEFFVNYSLSLLRSKAYAEAESIARQGLAIFANDKDILGNLTNALRLQGKLEMALEVSKRRLSFCRDVHSLEEVGHVLKELGDKHGERWPDAVKTYKDALRFFREAKKLNPRYESSLLGLIMTLRKLERFGDAMDECSALRDMTNQRNYKEACGCISADLLYDVGEHSKCIEFCKNWLPVLAHESHKNWMQRTYAQALCDGMIGMVRDGVHLVIREAMEFYQQKVENTASPRADDVLNWARIQDWIGETQTAFGFAVKAQQLEPDWWKPPAFKAEMLARDGQLDAAIQECNVAVALAPYRPEPLDRMAAIYKSANQPQQAEAVKRRADEVAAQRVRLSKD